MSKNTAKLNTNRFRIHNKTHCIIITELELKPHPVINIICMTLKLFIITTNKKSRRPRTMRDSNCNLTRI